MSSRSFSTSDTSNNKQGRQQNRGFFSGFPFFGGGRGGNQRWPLSTAGRAIQTSAAMQAASRVIAVVRRDDQFRRGQCAPDEFMSSPSTDHRGPSSTPTRPR